MIEFREFMFKNIYLGDVLKEERNKAKFVLKQVINYFYENPEEMPELYIEIVKKKVLQRGVADYIAGMSDDYCLILI